MSPPFGMPVWDEFRGCDATVTGNLNEGYIIHTGNPGALEAYPISHEQFLEYMTKLWGKKQIEAATSRELG